VLSGLLDRKYRAILDDSSFHLIPRGVMRFNLVDKITSIKSGESVTAVKNLSLAEEYLQDHFPGFPVMPGVLMLESLVQASAWLMRLTSDFEYSTVLLKQARALKFNSFLKPGDRMIVTSKLHRRDGERQFQFKASAEVNGVSTVSARLTLEQFNLADRHQDLRGTDTDLIRQMRELFDQLCTE
jgi:3-hydroxyacyl-[acyl-carrier-protein] dehydratase